MSYLLTNGPDLITNTVNVYTAIFSGYFNQFLNWGKWLFYSFAVIAIVWLCLWRAFDDQALTTSMSNFLKEFFLIAFFYTVMINAAPWLSSIVDTATTMGKELSGYPADPASIIQQGITIANKVLAPVKNSGVLSLGLSTFIVAIAYMIILAAFIVIALELALTLISVTFFISLSGMVLAFGTFSPTRFMSRRILDRVIADSFKLLTQYLVIAAGSGVFMQISNYIPTDKITTFDIYAWTLSAALLFCIISKKVPQQVAQVFLQTLQENRSIETISAIPCNNSPTYFPQEMRNITQITERVVNHAPAYFNKPDVKNNNNVEHKELADHFRQLMVKAEEESVLDAPVLSTMRVAIHETSSTIHTTQHTHDVGITRPVSPPPAAFAMPEQSQSSHRPISKPRLTSTTGSFS